MDRLKELLYRKYNKRARGFQLNTPGGAFRHQRNTKAFKNFEGSQMSIRRTKEGYDYTPLFSFLLSSIGGDWDAVFSEAVQRLDKQDPIFWLVDLHYKEGDDSTVRVGACSYFSKLTVRAGLLVLADPDAAAPAKSCTCCTHTFNGLAY